MKQEYSGAAGLISFIRPPQLVFNLLILVFVTSVQLAYGQATPQEQQQRQSDEFFRQEQLRQQEEQRKTDVRRQLNTVVKDEVAAEKPPVIESDTCAQITAIQLDGATLLSEKEKENITSPYLNTCVGLAQIDLLLRAITNTYINKGYISARPYIPQQDTSKGTLRIYILEGRIEGINKLDDSKKYSLATAFPAVVGTALNIRDIEQGLDQLNRLSSNNASMQIQPGSEPGQSDIVVQNQLGKFYHLSAQVDNYGSEATGKERITVGAVFDNLANVNDQVSLSGMKSIKSFSTEDYYSQSLSLSTSVPSGYWLFSGSINGSEYQSEVGIATPVKSSGYTNTYNTSASWVAHRSRYSKWTLSGSLAHKDTNNYIAGARLESSSRKSSTGKFGAIVVLYRLGGTWVVDLGYSRGLDILDTDQLPDAGKGVVPTPLFDLLSLNVSYSLPFAISDESFYWSSSFQTQYTNDYLYGSEQISIGGQYTVRGYETTAISGDRGWYWKNELSWQYQTPYRWLGVLMPYFALDGGHIQERDNQLGGTLIGSAIGIKNAGSDFSFNLMVGVPVMQSTHIKDNYEIEKDSFHLQLGWAY